MTTGIEFFAAGRPKTKGSTKFVTSKATGRAVPKTNHPLMAWQGVIACSAANAGIHLCGGRGVEVGMVFRFCRPKNHYGTGRNAAKLKDSAPSGPVTRNCGDLDKLARAVLDGLTGIAFKDDSQVLSIEPLRKEWLPDREGVEGVVLGIRVLS